MSDVTKRKPQILTWRTIKSHFSCSFSDRVIFLLGRFQNVSISQNETVQAVVSTIPSEVAFITLQFHTQHRNATMSYTRVSKC